MNTNPHMLPANVRDEFGIPVAETVEAIKTGELPVVHPALGFMRRTEVLEWVANR